MIPVTKTFLPPPDEYQSVLKRAWDKQWMTNRGELVLELEEKLKHYLAVKNIIVTNNGTVPLQIALKLLANGGEVITTPFSYVASTAAIVWENCTPVFVDIHPEYLTIDETKIEASITPRTTAILATHVFGNPCAVDEIESIARKYKLNVIYDGAHAFGVQYQGRSLFDYGDVSTCSFHATKLFHTGEGGALFCKDETLNRRMYQSHNFGHKGQLEFHGLGINGKISELQAALGLALLPYMEEILHTRCEMIDYYDQRLDFTRLQKLKIREHTTWNYSYYPVIFQTEAHLIEVQERMNALDIFPRRYFYPSLNTLPYVQRVKMEVSESIASRILCLPLYAGLIESDLEMIISCIL
ncbi:MAG TPA: DegT/DnrJ/EryC1/StrS family aminotransferase [Saprospiraceae bacterium]|nr:DegT/DnrJ/EryC1/StrS family aminotransferase [Saprospiraceae bacterium]